jgi:hypothetical protein
MIAFDFKTDSESQVFCESIVNKMVEMFNINIEEAVGRVNRAWRGQELIGPDRMIYHEDEEYWANTIYYGKDSYWWLNPPDLKPLPFL